MRPEETQPLLTYHDKAIDDVLSSFNTSSEGLGEIEAKRRLREYGANELPVADAVPAWKILLRQFANPLMLLLVAAGSVSVALGELFEAVVVAIALGINAILGFFEEWKADRTARELRLYLSVTARVRRAGELRQIVSSEVVPGDVLILRTGDRVIADARLIEVQDFEVDEAALTGESMPVLKLIQPVEREAHLSDRHNMVYAGTVVTAGTGMAIVVATGERLEFARLSLLSTSVPDEPTPLERKLARLARSITGVVLVLSLIVFVVGILNGHEVSEMLRIAVALAVSAVPEGLVVSLSVILAIGLTRILKREGLVRRLVSAETLGAVSVICVDKTGTLTTGVMSVAEVKMADSLDSLRRAIMLGVSALRVRDQATREVNWQGSYTEVALARYAFQFEKELLSTRPELVEETSFSSLLKFSTRTYREGKTNIVYTIGAPEVLWSKVHLASKELKDWREAAEEMARRGLRVLLVMQGISPLGLVGLSDPLRPEAAKLILEAKQAHLRPIMITGDHLETATSIAKSLGLWQNEASVIEGVGLDDLSDRELLARLEEISVYARVRPEQKLRIVDAWQRHGQQVAMMGDGVNDAPAIKTADIGIAVVGATAVAKEAADLVLLNNSFATILYAVKEGRAMFDNIRKTTIYLLADSMSEIILVMGSLIFQLPLPILPAQILWINLITDGLPSAALAFEPPEREVMRRWPRSNKEPIIDSQGKALIIAVSLVTDLGLFALYAYLLDLSVPLPEIRTFIFVALGLDSLFYVFAVRKLRTSFLQENPLENPYLIGAVAIGIILQILPLVVPGIRNLFGFVPLNALEWAILFALSAGKLLLIEGVKTRFRHLNNGS